MLRCEECKSDFIINATKYQKWLALVNFFELLYMEDEITLKTYESMTGNLLTFKPFAEDDAEVEDEDNI